MELTRRGSVFLSLLLVAISISSTVHSATLLKFNETDSFAGETVVRTGTCDNGKTRVEIRFNDAIPVYSLITVCHDEDTDSTLWTQHYIYGELLDDMEHGGTSPGFREGGFYPTISADDCYKQAKQTETIGMLLGSTALAQKYIDVSKNLFLARGHLVPNGDPIYQVEKHATYYFINASPQWQSINGGHWVALENHLRKMADEHLATLTVWTGTYGVAKLDDVNGNPVEIWLGRDSSGNLVRKLPVNHLTWKVIHDPKTKTAVAMIYINNPWLERVTDADVICNDVCDQLSWVDWERKDLKTGYTYCCTVASFRQKVPYAPNLGNLPLLSL